VSNECCEKEAAERKFKHYINASGISYLRAYSQTFLRNKRMKFKGFKNHVPELLLAPAFSTETKCTTHSYTKDMNISDHSFTNQTDAPRKGV
jgi:hypothetical protein